MILMIMRHGNAESHAAAGRDQDRQLVGSGIRQAKFIGEWLAYGQPPGLVAPTWILCSHAERARATATIIAKALNTLVTQDDALRDGTPVTEAVTLVRRLADRTEPVLIVGHNPQLEDLISYLNGDRITLRTGELVCTEVRLDGDTLSGGKVTRHRMPEED